MMSTGPAAIAGIAGQGTLEVGAQANIVVFDPTAAARTAATVSRSSNSPYLGLELSGKVVHTLFRGRVPVRNGALAEFAGVGG